MACTSLDDEATHLPCDQEGICAMGNQIQPRYLTLADLLHNRLFHIPDYQRSYSWSSCERKDLFEDIKGVHKEGDDARHFMATIVCLRRDKVYLGTTEFTILDIVDGQQRVTTLIILLNAICRALDTNIQGERRLAEELTELLVKPEGDNLLLLQTNHDASHSFANYMREGTAPPPAEAETLADKELLSAIQECKNFVEGWRKEGDLIELARLIKNSLSFILHEISDEKLVYTVFEVLNSRGMEVAWLDRLKSILMGLAFSIEEAQRGKLIDDLHNIWRDIYTTIGLRQGLNTEALQFAATLYSPARPSRPLDERDAVDSLRKMATDARQIRDIAQWLLKVTKACHKVMSDPRRNAVTRIAQARLLAVAIHLGEFNNEDRKSLLDCWERVSFRTYGLYDRDARTGAGGYCRLSWEILRSEPSLLPDDIRECILQLGKDYPIKEIKDVNECLKGFDCYHGWTDELRYFFFRYEEYLARKNGQEVENIKWEHVWANKASQSIEHIRPQSEAPEDIKHTLGNLMLLPLNLNSKLRDKPPREKAESYRRTGFYHVDEVVTMLETSPSWSKKTCKRRERRLLEWAAREWGED